MKSNEDVLDYFKRCYRDGSDAHSEYYEEDRKCHEFYAGKQWASEDKRSLEAEQRPALVFNAVAPVINAVSGSEITNRYEPKFLPRTVSDEGFNDRMSEIVRWQRQQTDAGFEDSYAFRDAVIAGIGCCEFYYDYRESEWGRLVVERVPMQEITWDPGAKKGGLTDRRWSIRGKWIAEDEFEAMWGTDALDAVRGAQTDREVQFSGASEIHDQTASNLYQSDVKPYDPKAGRVAVFDFQYRQVEEYYIVVNLETGERRYVSAEDRKLIQEQMDALPEEERPQLTEIRMPKNVYYRAWIAGDRVLEHLKPRVQNFTYQFVTGFQEQKEDSVQWFGLMRSMIDPQRWSNKMLSQIVHTVATNPKGAILTEEGVFENPAQARQEWAKPNAILETRMKALSKKEVQIIHGQYPSSMERIMEIAMEAIPRVSGVNPYMSGQVDDLRRTAQSAVQLVQRQGMVILSGLFDSLSRYRRECGRLHLDFIDAYLEEGTIVRVTADPLDPAGEPVAFDRSWIEQVEFDVVVDEAPVSPTASMDFWQTLMQTDAFGTLFEAGLLSPDIVADIMPNVPTSIRARMKENYRQALQRAQAEAQAQQEAAAAGQAVPVQQ